jgi:hypothetical protein
MDSADPPLGVCGVYSGRHRKHRRHTENKYTRSTGLLAVAALALQFFTGMYLFVLPYAAKWCSVRRAD